MKNSFASSPHFDIRQITKIIQLKRDGLSFSQISQKIGGGKTTVYNYYKEATKSREEVVIPMDNSPLIVFAAQDQTPVDKHSFDLMKVYGKEIGATLICLPTSYNDVYYKSCAKEFNLPSLLPTQYDNRISEYLLDRNVLVADDLMLLGGVNTLPTQVKPFASLNRMEFRGNKVIATPKQFLQTFIGIDRPFYAFGTGYLTIPNYIKRRAGFIAEQDHFCGFLVIERKDGKSFVRHVGQRYSRTNVRRSRTNMPFYDLNREITKSGVSKVRPPALVVGDVHAPYSMDVDSMSSLFDQDGILNTLKPREVFLHDLMDSMVISNYHTKEERFSDEGSGRDSARQELMGAIKCALRFRMGGATVYVVYSNHDDRILRWARDPDPKSNYYNIDNILFHSQVRSIYYSYIKSNGKEPNLVRLACEFVMPSILELKDFVILDRFQSVARPRDLVPKNKVELGQHGDRGPEGFGFSNAQSVGLPLVVGHSHTPLIDGRLVKLGTNSLKDLGYNAGRIKRWGSADAIVHRDGSVQLVVKEGKSWRYVK